jgi:hypothetical protein
VVNRRKSFASGGPFVIDLVESILGAMGALDFTKRSYPMLTSWGVRDEDVLVHSLGCSAWNTLGQSFGLMAVTECPAPMTHGADIRPDSTWFARDDRKPAVMIEFERFDGTDRGQQKLDEKLCNLLEASMRWGDTPSVLILSAWSKGVVSAPNKEKLLERCRRGFKSSFGIQVPPIRNTAVLFSRFIFDIENGGCLLLKQVRCERLL